MLQAYSYTGDDYDYNLKRQEVLNGVLSAYTDGWDYSRQETSEGWIVVASREAYGLIQDLVGILYQHKCVNRTFLGKKFPPPTNEACVVEDLLGNAVNSTI